MADTLAVQDPATDQESEEERKRRLAAQQTTTAATQAESGPYFLGAIPGAPKDAIPPPYDPNAPPSSLNASIARDVDAAKPPATQAPPIQAPGAPPPAAFTSSTVAAPPTTGPLSTDPFQATGGGIWTGQQWVPKDHPLAQPFLGGAPTTTDTGAGGAPRVPVTPVPPNQPGGPPGDAIPIEGPGAPPPAAPSAAPPTGTVIPPNVPPPPTTGSLATDPFLAMGGGVWTGQQWVPRNHPLAQPFLTGTAPGSAPGQPGYVPPTPPPVSPTPPVAGPLIPPQPVTPVEPIPPAAPTAPYNPAAPPGWIGPGLPTLSPGATDVGTPPKASGITTTPGSKSSATEDDLASFLKQRLHQAPTVDTQSAEFRSQADPYAAAQERARRQYLSESAERNSTAGKGGEGAGSAMDLARRVSAERLGQNVGTFESQLAVQEMQQKRAEIADALEKTGSIISEDKKAGLQRDLANLDAALKQQTLQFQAGESSKGRDLQKYTTDLTAILQREGRSFEGGENERNRLVQQKIAELNTATTREGLNLQRETTNLNAILQREARSFEGGENEKNRLLTRALADLDAAIKREGLAQTGQLGSADIALREKLGMGDLNTRFLGTLLNDKATRDRLGLDIGATEGDLAAKILDILMRNK